MVQVCHCYYHRDWWFPILLQPILWRSAIQLDYPFYYRAAFVHSDSWLWLLTLEWTIVVHCYLCSDVCTLHICLREWGTARLAHLFVYFIRSFAINKWHKPRYAFQVTLSKCILFMVHQTTKLLTKVYFCLTQQYAIAVPYYLLLF